MGSNTAGPLMAGTSSHLYKRYALGVLLLVLAFNWVDRFALGVVLQDIKVDLDLTDTQLGLMTGIAFALFYSLMGIPIARWADRGNRITIISLTASLWSAMVALCGLAGNFAQLLLIRIGVGIGEAGCLPTANSLLADYFPREERPRAMAIFSLGTSLGLIAGYFLAGCLNTLLGWRMTFLLLGAPGVLLAILARFTLKEPRLTDQPRAALGRTSALARTPQPGLKEVCLTLWANTAFRHVLFGFSVIYFFVTGILQWQPTFFVRSYGLTSLEVGTWFALIYGLGGLIGTYWGGAWATRRAARNEGMQLKAVALTYGALSVVSPFIYLAQNRYLAFGILSLVSLGSAAVYGPLGAIIQTLAPERMRAMAFAIVFFFSNLIGLGLGPLATGALSDALRPWAGEESLRYSLLVLSPGYIWAAWHFWRASRTVRDDVCATQLSEVRC